MNTLFNYSEFGAPNADSIIKHFSDTPDKYQNDLINYMKTHGETKCVCGLARDIISGKTIGTRTIISDGVFRWTNDLIYYVENYNLKLNDDFIQYVLNNN